MGVESVLSGFTRLESGKVRERYVDPQGNLVLIASDRISAFDQVFDEEISGKGTALTQISAIMLALTADIIPNHVIAVPDPNVMIVEQVEPLGLELIVRGALTGVTDTSPWPKYAAGARDIYGIHFPPGMHKNDLIDPPIVTPTTKAAKGQHDRPLTDADVQAHPEAYGLRSVEEWEYVKRVGVLVFQRIREYAKEHGLLLADTKMEFGRRKDGTLILIDELGTPDSSRYWLLDEEGQPVLVDEEPVNVDKEVLRREYAQIGYTGHGAPPPISPELQTKMSSEVYQRACEMLTGQHAELSGEPVAERIARNLRAYYGY